MQVDRYIDWGVDKGEQHRGTTQGNYTGEQQRKEDEDRMKVKKVGEKDGSRMGWGEKMGRRRPRKEEEKTNRGRGKEVEEKR